MIFDENRGHYWVNNILNLHAKRLLLCGEERAFQSVKNILALRNEEVELITFDRRSSLEIEKTKTTFSQVQVHT